MTRRVIHVASGREWRGGERQVGLLARALQGIGTLSQLVITRRDSELAGSLRAAGVPVHEVRWAIGLDPRALRAVVQQTRRGPTLLHAHDPHALILADLAARWTGRPLLATRRTTFPVRGSAWRRASRVIAISGAVRDTLLKAGVAAERIEVIHSGVSVEELQAVPRWGIRARLALPADTLMIVSVAALSSEKGHDTLLATAARLRESLPALHWAVAGEGPLRPAIEAKIGSLGLTGRVHLLGQLDEAAGLIAEADLFVSASDQEGLGTSILEALALGVPVVATEAGGVAEILGQGAGLLAPPRQPDVLADLIARLLRDRDAADRCRARARETISRFTDHGMAQAHLSVYRSLDSIH